VYAAVLACVVLAALGGRHRAKPISHRFQSNLLIVGGLAVPGVILLLLAVMTVVRTNDLAAAGPDPLTVSVQGREWFWDVTYIGGAATSNELHVPVGRFVDVSVTTGDVIHSLWIPQLSVKADAIPGQTNHLRFTAHRTGTYLAECAEFCGIQHAHMSLVVVVQSATDFSSWLDRLGASTTSGSSAASAGESTFLRLPCAGCHAIAGTGATATVGPNLTDIASRPTLGAGAAPNDEAHLRQWITDAPSLKPGTHMPPIALSQEDLNTLVTYLRSLH
jgi:cytochrome c oxidase subunit 2